jgi:hypothetical protein
MYYRANPIVGDIFLNSDLLRLDFYLLDDVNRIDHVPIICLRHQPVLPNDIVSIGLELSEKRLESLDFSGDHLGAA